MTQRQHRFVSPDIGTQPNVQINRYNNDDFDDDEDLILGQGTGPTDEALDITPRTPVDSPTKKQLEAEMEAELISKWRKLSTNSKKKVVSVTVRDLLSTHCKDDPVHRMRFPCSTNVKRACSSFTLRIMKIFLSVMIDSQVST